ncbi:thioredoxin family protein [Pseudomonas proteolytica]|uniref:thioredoxin family protein n=1 Tax=Pseudomonas proteolytica TaxID=219574 RepID=UPI0014744617|nr:thioredoxin family protein [Pseudomonas proteolytica]NMZ38257.1 hypothetical protein [Pseudomonas proteolytica]
MSLNKVDASSFESRVLKSTTPVIVLFNDASRSASNKMVATLEAAAQDQGKAIEFLEKTLEVNGSIEKTPAYDVQSAPTTLFFRDGKLVRTVVGLYGYADTFKAWVDQLAKGEA